MKNIVRKMMGLAALAVLTLCGAAEAWADTYQNVEFNSGVRYSQWAINSRIRDFYGNKKRMGFNTYDSSGTLQGTDISSGYWYSNDSGSSKRKFTIDYVAGLVAKAIVENVAYNYERTWAKPWYFSVQNYANQITAPNTGGSQDNMNAVKMYFALNSLASGAYSSLANADATTTKASTAFTRTATAFGDLNSKYAIGGDNSNSYYRLTEAAGGWFHKSEYIDQMWCDGLYMGSALLSQLINQTGVTTNISSSTNDWEIIYNQFRISWSQLYDSSKGLLYHAFTASPQNNMWSGVTETGETFHSAAFWGRACGWYMLALVDVLEQMQIAGLNENSHPQHSYYTTLSGYLNSLADGIKKYQDSSTKCWYQVLDEKDDALSGNYIEASCSAIFTAAYFKGIRLGLLASGTYSSVAENAYRGCVAQFLRTKDDGSLELINSCASAGLNKPGGSGRDGSRSYYINGSDVTKITNYTEGKIFGAFILASTEYERAYQASKAILFSTDLKASYDLEAGGEITIEACGADGATITYQWYKDGVAVDGETSATIAPKASGDYYCKATSGTTTITSSTAQVAVAGDDTFTPEFTTNLPATATATEGVAKTLTVAADHVESYQWYSNTTASNTGGQAISGATLASYTFTPATAGTLYYYCVATNSKATGTKSVASSVCTVTVSEAPEMWTAAGATYNSTSKGYEVEGRGTYYKATSGGEATSSTDNDATWAAGTYRLKTSDNLFIYSLANSVSGLKVYMRGSGNRTLSSVATASSLNGSYSTLTNNTDYTYSSTCTSGSYITTSDTRDVVTFTFTSALAAGTFVKITLSGNAYIYGIEPVTASQKTVNTLALSTESGEVTVGNTLDISSYVSTNSDATITYTSNNNGVATVTDAGVISGVAEGEATITVAQAETEEYTAGSATFTITVNAVPVTNYTVTFYDGSQYAIQTIEKGKTVTAPAISPTKEGYTFKGWALENGSTARVLFPYEVWSDVNFYAVWSNTTSGGGGEDETIFSAVPTTRTSITKSSTVEITSDNATITGGKLYAKNVDTSDKNMIQSSNSRMCYNLGNNNSCFKVELNNNKILQVGDQISVIFYFSGNSTKNMWLSSSSTRPNAAPSTKMSGTKTSSDDSFKAITYTVVENDGICGLSEFYIFREESNSTYFTDITITREGQAVGNDITLDAATDYENFDDYVGEGKNVTLRRNFTEGKWTTLVLPFSVTTEQLNAAFTNANECEIAKIKSMNVTQGNGSIHYTTVSSIEANKPVLAKIKPNANGEYVFTGVTVVAPTSVVSTSTDGNVEMHGVYKTTGYTQISEDAYFLSGGKFYDWSYLNAMSPFSAYILPVGANAQSVQYISFDDEATGIINLNVNPNLDSLSHREGWGESFNLAGQRVTKEYNGIVIIKGKKVFTK